MSNPTTKNEEEQPPKITTLPEDARVVTGMTAHADAPEQIETALKFLAYGRAENLSMMQLGERISRDGSMVSRLFSGSYRHPEFVLEGSGDERRKIHNPKAHQPISIKPIIEDIETFFDILDKRGMTAKKPFVRLQIVKEIETMCEMVRVSQTIGVLWGKNQSGKTWALRHVAAENNHGRTPMVEMPAGGPAKVFMSRILKSLKKSEHVSYNEMLDRAIKHINHDTLLIIDELHEAMIGRSLKMVTLSLIRQIHNATQCGILLCGTETMKTMLEEDKLQGLLGQLNNRGCIWRQLPTKPYKSDVRALCTAYGFTAYEPEAKAKVMGIADEHGIGKLCTYLGMAVRRAANQKRAVEWEDLLVTLATMQAYRAGEKLGGIE